MASAAGDDCTAQLGAKQDGIWTPTTDEAGFSADLVAMYDLVEMREVAYPRSEGYKSHEQFTASDLLSDDTTRREWLQMHDEEFMLITGHTAHATYDFLLGDAKARITNHAITVWSRNGGKLRRTVHHRLLADWKAVNPLWLGKEETMVHEQSGIPLRYLYGPAYGNCSCAFDCTIWVLTQLDAWRRQVDEYDVCVSSVENALDADFAAALRSLLRPTYDPRDEARRTSFSNYLRRWMDLKEGEAQDISFIMDVAFKGLPQMTYTLLRGVDIRDEEIRSSTSVMPKTMFNVSIAADETESRGLSFLLNNLIDCGDVPQDTGRRVLGSHLPYVLQVRPLRTSADATSGNSTLSWETLALALGGLGGITTLALEQQSLCGGYLQDIEASYDLVGVVLVDDVKAPTIAHYTVAWKRGEVGLYYDDMNQEGKAKCGKPWDFKEELHVISLFYEMTATSKIEPEVPGYSSGTTMRTAPAGESFRVRMEEDGRDLVGKVRTFEGGKIENLNPRHSVCDTFATLWPPPPESWPIVRVLLQNHDLHTFGSARQAILAVYEFDFTACSRGTQADDAGYGRPVAKEMAANVGGTPPTSSATLAMTFATDRNTGSLHGSRKRRSSWPSLLIASPSPKERGATGIKLDQQVCPPNRPIRLAEYKQCSSLAIGRGRRRVNLLSPTPDPHKELSTKVEGPATASDSDSDLYVEPRGDDLSEGESEDELVIEGKPLKPRLSAKPLGKQSLESTSGCHHFRQSLHSVNIPPLRGDDEKPEKRQRLEADREKSRGQFVGRLADFCINELAGKSGNRAFEQWATWFMAQDQDQYMSGTSNAYDVTETIMGGLAQKQRDGVDANVAALDTARDAFVKVRGSSLGGTFTRKWTALQARCDLWKAIEDFEGLAERAFNAENDPSLDPVRSLIARYWQKNGSLKTALNRLWEAHFGVDYKRYKDERRAARRLSEFSHSFGKCIWILMGEKASSRLGKLGAEDFQGRHELFDKATMELERLRPLKSLLAGSISAKQLRSALRTSGDGNRSIETLAIKLAKKNKETISGSDLGTGPSSAASRSESSTQMVIHTTTKVIEDPAPLCSNSESPPHDKQGDRCSPQTKESCAAMLKRDEPKPGLFHQSQVVARVAATETNSGRNDNNILRSTRQVEQTMTVPNIPNYPKQDETPSPDNPRSRPSTQPPAPISHHAQLTRDKGQPQWSTQPQSISSGGREQLRSKSGGWRSPMAPLPSTASRKAERGNAELAALIDTETRKNQLSKRKSSLGSSGTAMASSFGGRKDSETLRVERLAEFEKKQRAR